jgi:hypothetical protein
VTIHGKDVPSLVAGDVLGAVAPSPRSDINADAVDAALRRLGIQEYVVQTSKSLAANKVRVCLCGYMGVCMCGCVHVCMCGCTC